MHPFSMQQRKCCICLYSSMCYIKYNRRTGYNISIPDGYNKKKSIFYARHLLSDNFYGASYVKLKTK